MGSQLSYPSVDLSGRVAVVTGGNAGIGYETAKALAAMGAHTIIACRSRDRAEQVHEYIIISLLLASMCRYLCIDLYIFESLYNYVPWPIRIVVGILCNLMQNKNLTNFSGHTEY